MKKRTNPVNTAKVERQYLRQLRRIAKHVGDIINGFPAGSPDAEPIIRRMLTGYAETITGWATHTASQMLEAVDKQDEAAWMKASKDMARSITNEIRRAPTGLLMQALLRQQVELIKSLPLDAAQRVHRLTIEGIDNSSRASEIADEIKRSGKVSASRATLIARTEVARTASNLTQARAVHIGSEGYVWRTSGDSDVRDSHRKMNGKYVAWNDPPTLDGLTGHAGCLPNCRCYPEPIVPD